MEFTLKAYGACTVAWLMCATVLAACGSTVRPLPQSSRWDVKAFEWSTSTVVAQSPAMLLKRHDLRAVSIRNVDSLRVLDSLLRRATAADYDVVVDARIVCLIAGSNGVIDTLGIGQFVMSLNGQNMSMDTNIVIRVATHLPEALRRETVELVLAPNRVGSARQDGEE